MRLLITGGTGFLGSYLARYVVFERGIEHVVLLDRYIDRNRIADILDRVTVVESDVADLDSVVSAAEQHAVDHVAHFAFILGSPAPGQMSPYVRVQTLGTANVFEAARLVKAKRVLFGSSVAAYGKQTASVLSEDLSVNPTEPYGASKVWAEALARHYTEQLNLEVVTLRFGSTYGLGRASRGSYRSGLLAPQRDIHYMARIEHAARGEPIEMPRGDAIADWTYAADAAHASWLALTTERLEHRLFNVVGERRAIGDFTHLMRGALPDAQISESREEPGHPHPAMDGSRLRRELGFVPRYTMETAITDYIARIRASTRCLP